MGYPLEGQKLAFVGAYLGSSDAAPPHGAVSLELPPAPVGFTVEDAVTGLVAFSGAPVGMWGRRHNAGTRARALAAILDCHKQPACEAFHTPNTGSSAPRPSCVPRLSPMPLTTGTAVTASNDTTHEYYGARAVAVQMQCDVMLA